MIDKMVTRSMAHSGEATLFVGSLPSGRLQGHTVVCATPEKSEATLVLPEPFAAAKTSKMPPAPAALAPATALKQQDQQKSLVTRVFADIQQALNTYNTCHLLGRSLQYVDRISSRLRTVSAYSRNYYTDNASVIQSALLIPGAFLLGKKTLVEFVKAKQAYDKDHKRYAAACVGVGLASAALASRLAFHIAGNCYSA